MYTPLGLLQAAALGFTAIVVGIIVIFIAGILISAIKVVKGYERGVIFRVGRVRGGPKGPGLFILLPFIDRMVKVDLRIVTLDVPPQDVITRDNVPARVNAVVYFRVVDPNKSVVEVKDVEIPQQMQRAMARQAESERERRAKIIAAEGEYQASQRLRQAADRLGSPTALQLRLFQTLGEISSENSSTVILPVPMDLFRPYLGT